MTESQGDALATSIFQKSWWLDAVAPGSWNVAEVRSGEELSARLPYVLKKKMGLSIISTPKLTQVIGPSYMPTEAKYAKRLAREKELLIDLIDQLPDVPYCEISCEPELANPLPFHWAGFDLFTNVTYRITDLTDLDLVWSNFMENIRREIRKAEKRLEVRPLTDLDTFLAVNEKTFGRQQKDRPYDAALVKRIDDALAPRNGRSMWCAVDADEQVHAVLYIIHNEHAAYYLMGGGDPELRTSGASSLLMWHAIREMSQVTRIFDFEGTMIKPIERFVRGFGGVQTPYIRAVRIKPWLKTLFAAKSMLR